MEAVRDRAGALHGVLLVASFGAVWVALPALVWPWFLVGPMLAYAAVVLTVPRLRRTAPRLAIGQFGGITLWCAVVLSIATSVVLIAYQSLAHPDFTELAARLPLAWFGHWLVAGVCFSGLNAILEEVAFRGLLWGVVADEWNDGVALIVSALTFGVLHLHGYPPGPWGAVLAALYGVALGLLRWRTGGQGLAVACHVCADATIFGILVRSGAFGG